MTGFLVAGAALLGLACGSFLTVVTTRVPAGQSVVAPASRCPGCGHRLSPLENIPLVAFFALRGRCRVCGDRIPWRYPVLEAVTALVFVAIALRLGAVWVLPAFGAYATTGIALSAIDLETRRIPHKVLFPGLGVAGALLGVGAVLDGDVPRLAWGLVGAVGSAGFLLLMDVAYGAVRKRTGIGMGDVKLMLLLGLFTGYVDPAAPVLGLVAGFLAGTVGGSVVMARRAPGSPAGPTAIPFGPFLVAGSLFAVLWGPALLDWYLGRAG